MKKSVRREIAKKEEIKTSQPKELESKSEENLRTQEEKAEESVSLLETKEETTEAVKPTEPSGITPLNESEKSQESTQEEFSGATTKKKKQNLNPKKWEFPEQLNNLK